MADLTFGEMFGGRAGYDHIDEVSGEHQVKIDIRDFQNVADGGEIQNDLGISNLSSKYINFQAGQMGLQLIYALLLLILQNQAENINADPTQRIFVSEQSPRLGSGSRSGQIQRSFTVNFFTEGNITTIPDIDDIGGDSGSGDEVTPPPLN